MTSIFRNMYIDKLDNTVYEYSNTYQITIKMKPVDIKSRTYIDFGIKNTKEYSKREVDDHVRISKYQNIFGIFTLQIGLKNL